MNKDIRHLENIAQLMDNRFAIPGTSIRFGLDSIFGLVPGIGDTGTILVTLYLTTLARKHRLPKKVIAQMYRNAAIDWAIGLVPLAGDIFDIGFKANLRNVALLKEHIKGR
ncbi:MAG: hypothetical protein K0R10_2319 [Alphaproteobacteria bacterium]|jgi:hypothetical protein|nr:hypothetical protein [Alphaproteobacteria bacterium]